MKEAIDRAVIDAPLSKAMQRAVGMRNVLAHDYADVDWTLVVKVLRDDLEDLANFGRAVIAWMNGQQG
ncbi:MAG: HepT-like ribonuclease domain-containing protein [Burkholderiales bacterium]